MSQVTVSNPEATHLKSNPISGETSCHIADFCSLEASQSIQPALKGRDCTGERWGLVNGLLQTASHVHHELCLWNDG